MKQAKWFLLLHVILGIYAGSSVCSKLAAQQPFLSAAFIVLYGLMLLALVTYAVGWQQVIKHLPLTTAYANKAVTVVWGILLGLAKYIHDTGIQPQRRVYAHITVYEEVGHGGAGSLPQGVTDAISVDMGCVGEGLDCTERQVSICCKDSGGPYSYEVVSKLIDAAKRTGADYAVDVYPHYGSDVEATLRAGYDIRHGLIGAGVYASHGYERSHIDGVYNSILVLAGYTGVI